MQGKPVHQIGLTRRGMQFNPFAGLEHLGPRRCIGLGDIKVGPRRWRMPSAGPQQGAAQHMMAAAPDHKRACPGIAGGQRQAENPGMGFAHEASAFRPLGQHAVQVGRIAVLAIAEGSVAFTGARARITRPRHRDLRAVQGQFAEKRVCRLPRDPGQRNAIHRSLCVIVQRINTDEPCALADQPAGALCRVVHGRQGTGARHAHPCQKRRIGGKGDPAIRGEIRHVTSPAPCAACSGPPVSRRRRTPA